VRQDSDFVVIKMKLRDNKPSNMTCGESLSCINHGTTKKAFFKASSIHL